MYYELYIDVLFLENVLLDFLLLCLVKRLLGCTTTHLRLLAASLIGSAGICALYLFSLEGTAAGLLVIYVGLSTVMVKVGFQIKKWPMLGKAVALLYICSLLLGGIFQWVQRNLHFPIYPFLFFSLVSFSGLTICMRWLMRWRMRQQNIYAVSISFQGGCIQAYGLLDTGNHLQDPIFHKPVSIISEKLMEEMRKEQTIAFYQIPYHSVGRAHGMMPVFSADYLCIKTDKGEPKVISRPVLGVTKEPLSSKGDYDLILNPDLFG